MGSISKKHWEHLLVTQSKAKAKAKIQQQNTEKKASNGCKEKYSPITVIFFVKELWSIKTNWGTITHRSLLTNIKKEKYI